MRASSSLVRRVASLNLVLVAWAVASTCRGGRDGAPEPDPDWTGLRDSVFRSPPDSGSASFESVALRLRETAISAQASEEYVVAALDLARIGRESSLADPYEILVRVDSVLTHAPRLLLDRDVGAELASEYMSLWLPWRAEATLRRHATTGQVDTELRATLQARIDSSLQPIRQLGAHAGLPSAEGDPLRQQLLDLLTSPAAYELFDTQGSDDDYADLISMALTETGATASSGDPPLLIRPGDRSHVAVDLDEVLRLGTFVTARIPEGDVALLVADVLAAERTTAALEPLIRKHPVVHRITERLRATDSDPSLTYVVCKDGVLVLAFGSETSSPSIWVLRYRGSAPARMLVIGEAPLLPMVRLDDLTGDRLPEVIFVSVQGSGGFLDAEIYDPGANRWIFEAHNQEKGSLLLTRLRPRAPPSLIVRARVSGGLGCNQCPGLYAAQIFDYDPATQRLVGGPIGRSVGIHNADTHRSLLGVSPQAILELDGAHYEGLLDSLERTSDRDSIPEEMLSDVASYVDLLRQANAWERLREVASRLESVLRLSANEDLRLLAAEMRRMVVIAIWRTRGPNEALANLDDSSSALWFLRGTEHEVDLHNVASVVAFNAGDMDRAYRELIEHARTDERREGVPEGNLALYLREVGATRDAHRAATVSIDRAVRSGRYNGVAIDLLHLSVTAMQEGHFLEAADHVSRALAFGRAMSSGSTFSLSALTAAELALEAGHADIALALLDEAIVMSSDETWRSSGLLLLTLYGNALLAAGHDAGGVRALDAVLDISRQRGGAEYISAGAARSRYAAAHGDTVAALRFARDAFEATQLRRRNIPSEGHKFAFLANQETLRDWILELAVARRSPVDTVFSLVERAKMQVFLDVFRDTLRQVAPLSIQGVRSVLDRETALVDYHFGLNGSFAVVISKQEAVARVVPLPLTRNDAQQLVDRIRYHMDLSVAANGRAIRSGQVPATLRAALSEATRLIVDPLELPRTTRHLVIVPAAGVIGMPWAALAASDAASPVSRYTVDLMPSAFLGLSGRPSDERSPSKQALVVASTGAVPAELVQRAMVGSLGVGERHRGLAPLRSVSREVRAVVAALGSVPIQILGDSSSVRSLRPLPAVAATPADVLKQMPSARIIHVSAHALFNQLAPMQSALFIGARGTRPWISPQDLAGLDLRGVEIMSLAACRTGESRMMPGSEQIGFVRGLLGAGVQRVVLTEWPVDDDATADLFVEFYRGLSTAPAPSALREAQIAIAARHAHPFYWAGLTSYGTWR